MMTKKHKKTNKIGFGWARHFNKHSLEQHFGKHKSDFGTSSMLSYEKHALRFANTIDKANCKSFVNQENGITYKFNIRNDRFASIDRNGYVITYFIPVNGLKYYQKLVKDYSSAKKKKWRK